MIFQGSHYSYAIKLPPPLVATFWECHFKCYLFSSADITVVITDNTRTQSTSHCSMMSHFSPLKCNITLWGKRHANCAQVNCISIFWDPVKETQPPSFCNIHLLYEFNMVICKLFPFDFKKSPKQPYFIKFNVLDSARTSGAWPLGGPQPILHEFHKLIWNFIHKSICTQNQYRMSSSTTYLDVNTVFIHLIS